MARIVAVLVGCNYAQTTRVDVARLKSAENDARAMSHLILNTGDVLGMLILLLGAEATRANITGALRQAIATQHSDDTLLFYFSGHGKRSDDGLRLCAVDEDFPTRDLLKEFKDTSRRARIVLDCCHAAAIAEAIQP